MSNSPSDPRNDPEQLRQLVLAERCSAYGACEGTIDVTLDFAVDRTEWNDEEEE